MPSEKRARQRANRQAKVTQQVRSQRRRRFLIRGAIVVVVGAAIGGTAYALTGGKSSSTSAGNTTTSSKTSTTPTTGSPSATAALQAAADKQAAAAGCPTNPSTRVNNLSWSSAPPMTIDPNKTYTAEVQTDTGSFTVTLNPSKTPVTVNNFVFLADHGFYHCVIFHRVIPGFMDQTGDPTGTGTGGPGYTIKDEFPAAAANPRAQYPLGSVAMANTGQPNSGGSQWFVVAGPEGESLPAKYALFGQVTSGMSVVQQINKEGNPSPQSNGVPPKVTYRILSVKIHES